MPYEAYSDRFPQIKIHDENTSFRLTVREALNRIMSRALGARLLSEINATGPTFPGWENGRIKIYRPPPFEYEDDGTRTRFGLLINYGGRQTSKAVAVNDIDARNPGAGSPSGVAWNSNVFVIPGQGSRPPFIGLAHELIHASHNCKGIKKADLDD